MVLLQVQKQMAERTTMDYFFNQAILNKYVCSKAISNYIIAEKW